MKRIRQLIAFLGVTVIFCGLPLNGYAQTRVYNYRNGRVIYNGNGRVRLETGVNYNRVLSNGGNGYYGTRRGYGGNTTRRTGTQTPGENGRAHTTRRTGTNSPFR